MSMFPRRLWTFAVLVLLPAALLACSVPVFRYALDHWHPDAYRVFVYHDEDLNDQDQTLLQRIRDSATADGANLQVRTIDLRSEVAPQDRSRLQRMAERGESDLPRMVVNLPGGIAGGEAIVGGSAWSGKEVENLLRSPARTEIGERLIQGEVVWVYLESGRAADDEIRFGLLEAELAKQQETLELPAIDPNDLDELSGEPEDLAIRFTAMRISRGDPAEKWFTEMLLSIEPDLRDDELAGEPMVFPVFGRGRALYALVGNGINPDVIQEAALFLTGACQCTVKAENPGVDLLIPVRWEQYIQTPEPEAFELPLVGLAGMVPDSQDAVGPEPDARLAAVNRPQVSEPGTAHGSPEKSPSASRDSNVTGSVAVSDQAASSSQAHGSSQTHGSSELVAVENPVWLRWLPWGVLAAIGLIVLVSVATLLRRQENL